MTLCFTWFAIWVRVKLDTWLLGYVVAFVASLLLVYEAI